MTAIYPITRRPAVAYFHGGVSGLPVGGFIVPAGQVATSLDDLWYFDGDPDFCFVTVDVRQAWYSALLCEETRGAGAVYRVAPQGRLRLDLRETGFNFACRRARILALVSIPAWARAAYRVDPRAFSDGVL